MKYLLCALLACSMIACSTVPTVAPAPSVAPVRASNALAIQSIKRVQQSSKEVTARIKSGQDALAKGDTELAKTEFEQAFTISGIVDKSASEAAEAAAKTAAQIGALEQEINTHHENEKRLAALAEKYKGFWESGHKWWGLGAVVLGVAILTKHLFILAAVLVLLCVLLWGLSMVFPALSPVLFAVIGPIKQLFRKR